MAAVLELKARLDNLLATAQEETKDIFAPITKKEECPMCLIPLPFNEGEIMFHIVVENVFVVVVATKVL